MALGWGKSVTGGHQMWDFSLLQAFGLMLRTAPFIVLRMAVYFGIAVGIMLATGVGAGIGWGIGAFGEPDFQATTTAYGGVFGLGAAGAVLYFVREYILYMVKAGHIAVLVELVEGRDIPGGKGQIEYARRQVQERFATSTVLFGLDQLIKGILRAFNRAFFSIATLLPIPGAAGAMKFLNTIIALSLTYLDEVILAYLMKTRTDNPWAGGRTALILYAQNYTKFLKNAVWLAIIIWAATLVVFLVVLGPVALLVGLFPGTAGPLTLIVALVFAWGIKQALIEPIGMTALMQVYFKVTEGQVANPEWEAKLEKVSSKFRELKGKATAWPGESAGQTAR